MGFRVRIGPRVSVGQPLRNILTFLGNITEITPVEICWLQELRVILKQAKAMISFGSTCKENTVNLSFFIQLFAIILRDL